MFLKIYHLCDISIFPQLLLRTLAKPMLKHLSRNLILYPKHFPVYLSHPFSSLLFSFPAGIWFIKLLWHIFLGLALLLFGTSDHALLFQQYLLGFIDYFLRLLHSNWSFCPDFGALLAQFLNAVMLQRIFFLRCSVRDGNYFFSLINCICCLSPLLS